MTQMIGRMWGGITLRLYIAGGGCDRRQSGIARRLWFQVLGG
jgi:hypothetical protein